MVFNINIGFSGLQCKGATDENAKTYALFVGDTVLVNEVGHFAALGFNLYVTSYPWNFAAKLIEAGIVT